MGGLVAYGVFFIGLFWVPTRPRNDRKILVFVGGLQRSGTTTAAAVLATVIPASQQTVEHLEDRRVLEDIRKWRGQSKSYFRSALASGGLEGKFAQHVYPYRYALRDWGTGGREALERLTVKPELASQATAVALWQQWRVFWNATSTVLVEKTPENVLMAPYLHAMFDGRTIDGTTFKTAFVFVLRHPLPWALSIEKWLVNKWNRKKTTHLQASLDNRFDMWLEVFTQLFRDVSTLQRTTVFHAELADLDPTLLSRRNLQFRLSLGPHRDGSQSFFHGYNDANLAYIACWLDGGTLRDHRRCVKDEEIAERRKADLIRLRERYGDALLGFGYGLPDFTAYLCGLGNTTGCRVPPRTSYTAEGLGLRIDALDWPQHRYRRSRFLVPPPPPH